MNKDFICGSNTSWWQVRIHKEGAYVISEHSFSNRFADDKVFEDNGSELIILDGIVLNKKELFQRHKVKTLLDFCRLLYNNNTYLAKEIIGPFTLFIYNKETKTGCAFSSQIGDGSVFYCYDNNSGEYILSNSFNKLNSVTPYILNEQSCHQLLTYGFIIDDQTVNSNIRRLRPGKKLLIASNDISIHTYHRLKYDASNKLSLDEAIEVLDKKFRKAVTRCFDKDLEYGYVSHLVDISAGLDSRMVNWVAKDLGYQNIVNISYSQSGSSESKYATMLASRLGNAYYHRNLDDATFLFDIDDTSRELYGLAYYCGITGGRQFLRMLDFNRFGLEHTGQIGDVVIGSFVLMQNEEVNLDAKRTSTLLPLDTSFLQGVADECDNQEEFLMYSRALQGAMTTHYLRSNYTYAVSPFLDIELLEFCASLPASLRANHKLYWAWIDKKYPEAGKIPSSRLRTVGKSTQRLRVYSNRVLSRLKRDGIKIGYRMGVLSHSVTSDNMNPHDYWFETNVAVRKFISEYFRANISVVENKAVAQSVTQMYGGNKALDKLLAISLLCTIKNTLK